VRVSLHIVEARREKLAQLIGQHRYLPIHELCRRLDISEATVRRDLAALVKENKITRTYGGALSEFNDRFPSFRERQAQAGGAKHKLAKRALGLIQPGQTCFFDSGTTIFAIAEAFRENPITPVSIVTSNLPVGEVLAGIPDVQVFQLAGQLFHRQSILLGETAQKSLEFWQFDLAFLSAEAMNAEGIWNSQPEIIEQQKAVLRRSARSVYCLDGSKLDRDAPHFLTSWKEVDELLTDVSPARLKKAGIQLTGGQLPGSGRTGRLYTAAGQSAATESNNDLALFNSSGAQSLKEQICEMGRRMWMRGYCEGNGGNISCRLGPDRFIVTPTGVSKGFMTPDMMCLVDGNGKQLAGTRERTSEITTHLAIYNSTPDAVSVCHAHPCHAGAFAIKELAPPQRLIPELELFVGQVAVAGYETPGSPEIAASIAPLAPLHQSIIMGCHGVICWGKSVEDAYFKMEITDSYCRTVILAQSLPGAASIPLDKMDDLFALKKKLGLPDARYDLQEPGGADPWSRMRNLP